MSECMVKIVDFDKEVSTQVVEGESQEFELTVEELEERLEFAEGNRAGCGSCSYNFDLGCL